MNQILQVERNSGNKGTIDTKKIVLVFAIAIIVFGLILLGQGAYGVYQKIINKSVDNNPRGTTTEEVFNPDITLTKTEDNKLIIDIQSDSAISHIIYNWNNNASETIEESGKTNIEEIIDIPSGENVLNISIINSNGKEFKRQETFVVETTKPEISLFVIGNDIKISVTSKEELSYVTYKWNTDAENKEDMITYEDRTKFEKLIEIPKGHNTLKIVAVDKNNNSTEKSQEIKGVTKAKTSVLVSEGYLNFTVTGEENINKVEFEFNGDKFLMNKDTFKETTTVHYKVKMVQGWNYLKVISTTDSGAVDTTVWKYEYTTQD